MTSTRTGFRKKKAERGASVVEFALIAPLLFFFLFAIIDVCVLFWVNLTMQYAVREGARYAVTGRSDFDPNPEQKMRHRAVIRKIQDSSMGLYDQVKAEPRINSVAYSDPTKYTETMFGVPGEIVVLELDCTWPVMTPFVQPFFQDGKYRFTVAATMRNEAYR